MKQILYTLALAYLVFPAALIGQNGPTKLKTDYVITFLNEDTGIPELIDSTHYTYNEERQLIERLQIYTNNMTTWIPVDRYVGQTYDMNGNLLREEWQTWDSNDWLNYILYEFTYDTEGRKTGSYTNTWDGAEWVLNSDYAITLTYDSFGHLVSEISQIEEILYTYNPDGYVSTKTTRDKISGAWTNVDQLIYEYLPQTNGLIANITRKEWNFINWLNDNRTIYEYDANGNTLTFTVQKWYANAWQDAEKQFNTLDSNGKLINKYYIKFVNNAWVNVELTNYTYDSDGDLTVVEPKLWYAGSWKYSAIFRFYYQTVTDTHAPDLADVEIFPNPASTSITLKSEGFAYVKLFNLQGQQVGAQDLQGISEETIQLGHLPSANYLIQFVPKSGAGKPATKLIQVRN